MRNFSLILLVTLFGLGACDFQSKEDTFIEKLNQDYDAGVPVETLISRIEEGFYFEPLPENILGEEGLEIMVLDDLKKRKVENFQAANDIRKFYGEGCSPALKSSLYLQIVYPEEVYWTFEGVLLEEGTCGDLDLDKAISFYRKALVENPNYFVALARLGALYWEGQGVFKDRGKASQYFRRAAVQLAPVLFIPENELGGTYLTSKNSKSYQAWGLQSKDLLQNFTTDEIGPWKIPSGLKDELEKIKQTALEGPKAMVSLAKDLENGAGQYDQNANLAYEIVNIVAQFYQNQKAIELRKGWERDVEFCGKRLQIDDAVFCQGFEENGLVVLYLEEKKMTNLMASIFPALYSIRPKSQKEKWARYFWLFTLKDYGFIITHRSLREAAEFLNPAEVKVLEEWGNHSNRFPYEFAPD